MSLDRDALARDMYKGTYSPAYSVIPDSVPGANEAFKVAYGVPDGREIPCQRPSSDAGRAEPAVRPGPLRGVVVRGVRRDQGQTRRHLALPRVNLQSTEWVTYTSERVKDAYPLYQLGWFPFPRRRQLSDAVLHPGQLPGQPLRESGDHRARRRRSDAARPGRAGSNHHQNSGRNGQQLSTIPLLTGKRIAVAGKDIEGVTLDKSFKFELAPLQSSAQEAA